MINLDLAAEKLNTKRLRARYASLSRKPETHISEMEEIQREMRRSRGLCALIEAHEFFADLTEEDVSEWATELEVVGAQS